MFEVIISHGQTGRVQRGFFGTRDEAEKYVAHFEARVSARPRQSLRDYRIEVHYRQPPVLRHLPTAA